MANEATSNWKDFSKVAKLDINLHGTPDALSAEIYANSRHMIEAVITVQLQDKSEKPLNVTDDELKRALYLCRFDEGTKLKSPWKISDKKTEYIIKTTDKPSDTDNLRYVSLFISCSPYEGPIMTEDIAVGILVPDVGAFDTSRNGTTTKGHVFKAPKSVKVRANPAIDYSTHDRIKIACDEFDIIESDIKWLSRCYTSNINCPDSAQSQHGGAKCKRRLVHFRPDKSLTGLEEFKSVEIDYEPIDAADVSTGHIPWTWGDTKGFVKGFTLFNDGKGYGRPGAVVGRGWGKDDYQVNLWYSSKSHIRIDDKFYSVDDLRYYRFNDDEIVIDENHSDDDGNGLLLYKLIMPVRDTAQAKWKDVIRDITVKVTDFYGNEGSVQLKIDDDKNFDEPILKSQG